MLGDQGDYIGGSKERDITKISIQQHKNGNHFRNATSINPSTINQAMNSSYFNEVDGESRE